MRGMRGMPGTLGMLGMVLAMTAGVAEGQRPRGQPNPPPAGQDSMRPGPGPGMMGQPGQPGMMGEQGDPQRAQMMREQVEERMGPPAPPTARTLPSTCTAMP